MVIYGHAAAITGGGGPPDLVGWLGWGGYSGDVAVDLFFITSGFLVTGSILRQRSVLTFLWARALRIVPGYAVCMLASAFVLGALSTSLPLGEYMRNSETRDYVWRNLHFGTDLRWELPGVFIDNPQRSTVNGSIWTLPAEVRLYVWIALLGLCGVFSRRWLATLVLALLLLCSLVAPEMLCLGSVPEYPRWGGLFVVGAACFVNRDRVPLHGGIAFACVCLAWALRATSYYPFAFAAAEVAFVFWFAYGTRWYGFNRFGDYSFGLYLWGFPMQQQLVAHQWPQLTTLTNAALGFGLALLIGIASWHLVEKPALGLKSLPSR